MDDLQLGYAFQLIQLEIKKDGISCVFVSCLPFQFKDTTRLVQDG